MVIKKLSSTLSKYLTLSSFMRTSNHSHLTWQKRQRKVQIIAKRSYFWKFKINHLFGTCVHYHFVYKLFNFFWAQISLLFKVKSGIYPLKTDDFYVFFSLSKCSQFFRVCWKNSTKPEISLNFWTPTILWHLKKEMPLHSSDSSRMTSLYIKGSFSDLS